MRLITMYICICSGVTEQEIRDAVESGQASNLKELGTELGVGINCGSCHCEAERLLGAPPRSRTGKHVT